MAVATTMKQAEKRVLKAFEEFREKVEEAPESLKKAFDKLAESLRHTLAFASRAELAEISAKVDELAKRVDNLLKKKAKAS